MHKLMKTRALLSIIMLPASLVANADKANRANGPAFVVHKLADSLYAIGEPTYYQKNCSYLLVGEKQALMFDAGANHKEDITAVAKTTTDKPLSVLPSHLHFDHLGGLHNFQSVFLVDTPFTRKFKREDGLYHVPESVHLGNFDHMVVPPFKVACLVRPGETVDLGGLQVILLRVPGHTKGEIMFGDLYLRRPYTHQAGNGACFVLPLARPC